MRRTIAVFLTLLTLSACALATAACGGQGSPPDVTGSHAGGDHLQRPGAEDSSPEDESDAASGAGQAGAGGEAGKEQAGAGGEAGKEWTTAGGETGSEGVRSTSSFSEVLIDNEQLYFAITDAREDSVYGYTWKVKAENRTDRNLMFTLQKVSVNGVMCDPFWADVVSAGKTANQEIVWMRDNLDAREISQVTRVDLTLSVYNDDDYTEGMIVNDPFTIFPLGEEKETLAVRTPKDTDRVLVDNDTCSIVLTGFEPAGTWGFTMNLYLTNKSGRDLMFTAQNVSVNGIMCDPFWAEIVSAEKCAAAAVTWDRNSLSENGIGEVEEIGFPLLVCPEGEFGEALVRETLTISP